MGVPAVGDAVSVVAGVSVRLVSVSVAGGASVNETGASVAGAPVSVDTTISVAAPPLQADRAKASSPVTANTFLIILGLLGCHVEPD
jgi:hypothetical protein